MQHPRDRPRHAAHRRRGRPPDRPRPGCDRDEWTAGGRARAPTSRRGLHGWDIARGSARVNVRRGIVPILAAVSTLPLLAPTARAADGPTTAWWTRSNIGLVPSAGEPGVSEGQLVVGGASAGEDGWVSASAVAFSLT